MSNYMNDCPEPTLTCSEVVERLRKCFHRPLSTDSRAWFDWKMAESILDEWREQIRKFSIPGESAGYRN